MMSQLTEAEGTFEGSHDQTQTTTLTCLAGWGQETHSPEIFSSHIARYSPRFQFSELTGKTGLPDQRFGTTPQVSCQLPRNLGVCSISYIADEEAREDLYLIA